MTGKDIFLGLQYIGEDLIETAEYGVFPASGKTQGNQHRRIRSPFLLAALIALLLLLVGCAVVYVLSLQELKLGENQITYEIYDPRMDNTKQKTQTQQVLTLAGLGGTPAFKGAQEWYAFLKSYDPDRAIRKAGNEVHFPEEYRGYYLYSQEMKDKLDEIIEKYNLKLQGREITFETSKLLMQALGMETVLNPTTEATMRITNASYYQNGNLNLHFTITIPNGEDSEKTGGHLYYRPKDCFIPDTAVLTDVVWEEWNYTTVTGDPVLIIRSDDSSYAWFFCDMGDYTTTLQLYTVRGMYEDKEDGIPVAKFDMLSKFQLEKVADAIDFSIEPRLADGWESLSDNAASAGQEINGYRIAPVSAFTDGYAYRITLRITAPEGVALTDPNDHTVNVEPGSGVYGRCEEDGDGKVNTCNYIISNHASKYDYPEDGGLPYPKGHVIPIYLEDLNLTSFDFSSLKESVTLLTEGTWRFDVALNDADTREIELLSRPITASGSVGWTIEGTDVSENLEVTSIKLRAMGIHLTCQNENADFFRINHKNAYLIMKDGSVMQLTSGWLDPPIDLDQVACVQLADCTILPVPGVSEDVFDELSQTLPIKPEGDELPKPEGGIELLSAPVMVQTLAGYCSDPTGDIEPLYEYFQLSSFLLYPEGAVVQDRRAYEQPDTEIRVVMQDGREILLTNNGCGRTADGIAFSTFEAETTLDLSKVAFLQLPDGTQLTMP